MQSSKKPLHKILRNVVTKHLYINTYTHTYINTYIHTCMHECIPTYLPAYLPACLPACLKTPVSPKSIGLFPYRHYIYYKGVYLNPCNSFSFKLTNCRIITLNYAKYFSCDSTNVLYVLTCSSLYQDRHKI